MRRRTFIASAVGIGTGIGLAGCAATKEEFEATPGRVDENTVEETGYEQLDRREIVEERTREVAGEQREVTVTNYATPYRRRVEIAGEPRTLGAAVVFTTPSISIIGQEFNPVADWSLSELVENARGQVEDQLDGEELGDASKVGEREMTVLDEATTVGVFEATTEVEGSELTLQMPVTRVKHGEDFVIVAATYPEQLADDERPRAERLFGNVEHDAD